MLALAVMCFVLGCWNLVQWELHDAALGLGISALLLYGARWEWQKSTPIR
jgi:hypothetical protein